MQEKGTISVNTENIFPIIKKFLYSDHEIFLRELVSNAIDATQKIKRLASLGEYQGDLGELKVKVSVNKEAKTITVSDSGIGMTAEEIKKYINQVAFSGATEFLEKYKDEEEKNIIGHFGLGFYSAFMVASKVQVITKSYQEGSEAAQWTGEGSTEFLIEKTVRKERGTDIILHIAEDSEEFLESARIKTILNKYGRFLAVPIEFEEETINETEPIWTKSPNDLTDEDYKEFYKSLYPFSEDPLFWIHLNVDYPFNLTGVLYFPKIKQNIDIQKEKIQLYSRQVFITDQVDDVVPEFLRLLHGVIDSPDIPLNVSRSFLQADANVKKINGYITRKVADKLSEIFKADRKAYEEKWDSIGLFVKYGYISDDKFSDKAKGLTLLQNTDKQFFTFEEYQEHVKALQTDKNDTLIMLYTTDPGKQNAYIKSTKKKGYDVLLMDNPLIDNHFLGTLESKLEKVSLKRVDADTVEKLVEKEETQAKLLTEEQSNKIKELFEKVLDNKLLNISVEGLPTDELPVVITQAEFMRRMQEMQNFMGAGLPQQLNVAVNANHSLVQQILDTEEGEKQENLVRHSYDLALLSQNMLSGEALTNFIERSVNLVG